MFLYVGPQAPSSALPIGAERTVNPTRVNKVTPNQEILHSVVGVSHAKTQEGVLETNLAGFLYMYRILLFFESHDVKKQLSLLYTTQH